MLNVDIWNSGEKNGLKFDDELITSYNYDEYFTTLSHIDDKNNQNISYMYQKSQTKRIHCVNSTKSQYQQIYAFPYMHVYILYAYIDGTNA